MNLTCQKIDDDCITLSKISVETLFKICRDLTKNKFKKCSNYCKYFVIKILITILNITIQFLNNMRLSNSYQIMEIVKNIVKPEREEG